MGTVTIIGEPGLRKETWLPRRLLTTHPTRSSARSLDCDGLLEDVGSTASYLKNLTVRNRNAFFLGCLKPQLYGLADVLPSFLTGRTPGMTALKDGYEDV